jgi:hypothetical protein
VGRDSLFVRPREKEITFTRTRVPTADAADKASGSDHGNTDQLRQRIVPRAETAHARTLAAGRRRAPHRHCGELVQIGAPLLLAKGKATNPMVRKHEISGTFPVHFAKMVLMRLLTP